jgi:Zn-dependent protease
VRGGYLTLGRWRGAPVRAHWTLPLGALLFSHGRFAPGFWIGFFLLVLVHEIGHAILVRRYHLAVVSIDIHGLGGLCRYGGDPTAIQTSKIAWGGVLAQGLLLGATYGAIAIIGPPPTDFSAELATAFISTNLWLIAINLIPVPGLDGAEAWRLPGLLRARRRARAQDAALRRRHDLEVQHRAVAAELIALEREPSRRTKEAVNAILEKIAREPGRKDN